jgi:hypothetical protein
VVAQPDTTTVAKSNRRKQSLEFFIILSPTISISGGGQPATIFGHLNLLLHLVRELAQSLSESCQVKRVAAFHQRELFCVYYRRHQLLRLVSWVPHSLEPRNGLTGEKRGSEILA